MFELWVLYTATAWGANFKWIDYSALLHKRKQPFHAQAVGIAASMTTQSVYSTLAMLLLSI